MKKIIVFGFLFISVAAKAQNDAAKDTVATPVITAVGKPDGSKTEIIINKDGGSLKSSDGMAELVIPAGAVSKKTNFSIQPIKNLIVNGNGKAYQLEPSGIRFQKQVQLILHYDAEETTDSTQFLLGIAMQDHKGQWYGLNKFTLDTVAKTISGNIDHFSIWAMFDKLKLKTLCIGRLKVKRSCQINILGVDWRTPQQREEWDEEENKRFLEKYFNNALSPLTSWKQPHTGVWRVNNIIKGNAEFGILKRGTVDESKADVNAYTAPDNVPDWNPVTISVDLVGASFKINDKTVKNLSLKTKVLIYDDAYEVTMISEIQDPGVGTILGAVNYRDTGSFVVSLNGREPRIIERVNKHTSASLVYSGGCCYDYKLLKPGSGNIHIAGTPVIKKTPPAADGKPVFIEISFSRVPSIFPLFQVTCKCPEDKKPFTATNDKGVAMMAGILPAFPILIKFEAKEGEHTILELGKPGEGIYAKFTVKQLKDKD